MQSIKYTPPFVTNTSKKNITYHGAVLLNKMQNGVNAKYGKTNKFNSDKPTPTHVGKQYMHSNNAPKYGDILVAN